MRGKSKLNGAEAAGLILCLSGRIHVALEYVGSVETTMQERPNARWPHCLLEVWNKALRTECDERWDAQTMSIGVQFCCDDMKYYVGHSFLYYNEVFDEYGIQCLEDGGASNIEIRHCPWCGKKLPLSQREKWFDELAEKGFDAPLGDDTIPDEYKSKKWRTQKHGGQ